MTDFYYLVVLPFGKLHRLEVEAYEAIGSIRRLLLAQRSQVQLDTAGAAYAAVFQGIEIATEDATFCPIDDHRIAFYSRTARTLYYPLPPAWKRNEVTARTLSLQGPVPCTMQLTDNMIVIEASAKQPVIVYASKNAIPQMPADS